MNLALLYNLADGIKEEDFERWYEDVHLGDVKKIPGLKRFSYSVARGAPEGEPAQSRLVILSFEDMESMRRALDSPEAKHAVDDAMARVKDLVTAFYEEVHTF